MNLDLKHRRPYTVDSDEAEAEVMAQLYLDQTDNDGHQYHDSCTPRSEPDAQENLNSVEPVLIPEDEDKMLAQCETKGFSPGHQSLSPRIDLTPRAEQYVPAVSSSNKFTSPMPPIPKLLPLEKRLYEYKALKEAGDIRLLSVSKSSTDGKIYFQLTRQKMSDCAPYAAISYTWGSTKRNRPIYHRFTDEILFVTVNCEAALGNLFTNGSRMFWIDAICIDQSNVAERSHQVSIMADIFRNASGTIIYLGEPDEHSTALNRWRELKVLAGSEAFLSDSTLLSAFRHVEALLSRPWHRRTWVIQEVLLSKLLVVQAGRHMIAFEHICKLLSRFIDQRSRNLGVLDMFIRYGSEPVTQTRHLHRFGWLGPRSSKVRISAFETAVPSKGYLRYWQLFNLLLETSDYQCRDARDKLYALLSLFDGDIPSELTPDYSLDIDEVYANVTRFLLMSEGITTALSAAQGPKYSNSLPSWVVDWRRAPTTHNLMHGPLGDRSRFSAGLAMPYQQIPHTISSGRSLLLRGIRVAQVQLKLDLVDNPTDRPVAANHIWLIPHLHLSGISTVESECHLPKHIWPLDVICVFIGFEVPFVMRPIIGNKWLLVGECFVEEIMHGQALRGVEKRCLNADRPTLPLEDFEIV